jgi:uncharacterized membrane protein
MKILHTLTIMFIFSFLIQYFAMPYLMINSLSHITNNIGKAYLAVIMGLSMVLIEIGMHDMQYGSFSTTKYVIITAFLGLFIYLYRKQVAIKDKEYVKAMIEHHSMAIFMSEEILKKTDNYNIAKLAKNNIQIQEDEIREMKELIRN